MKTTKKFFSIATTLFAGLFTVALPLATTTTLTACGKDNTAGTDEQQNSITAALDSALTEWLANDTLKAPEPYDPQIPREGYFIIDDPSSTIRNSGINVKNGTLYSVVRDNFESLTCETETNWFVYSVNAGDSLIRKYLVLPDSLNADDFESDCIAEGGAFGRDTTSKTAGQHTHSCDLESSKHLNESRQYVDPTWKKYVELIVGICQE